MFGRQEGVERELRATAPHEMVAAARALLIERAGALDAALLLADYGRTVLQPVTELPRTAGALPIADDPWGIAFSQQIPVVAGMDGDTVVHAPVTVRGDRLGVLAVSFGEPDVSRELVADLAEFAGALGHELLIADRETDLFQQARRRRRLTLAAEMQWQLLPGTGCARKEFALGGHLEPAYAVGGDNFDWCADADQLVVTVTDGMGQGVDASLVTSLAVNAMRNARRAGLDVVGQATLADQALFGQYGGAAHAATLLLRFDLTTGRVSAVDAGSPRVYRHRDGHVEQIELIAQMPLGMAEDTPYEEQSFLVEPGDRLVLVSSGVHRARSDDGTEFGRGALHDGLRGVATSAPYDTARAVVGSLFDHIGGGDLESDAAVVVLDWSGG
ncbi:Serine phosphatase RsbU, regulator of sigma subunit [Actinacidiphila alni]|uniref:Serine phosphatase RsbU, regulator of sigma subunit n=1 Tax=Actinacidiphila alni TaxID=380248 RepID=A0A1I2LDN0_9ACTN|nr:PP2C family protein-serine/threonine phosphatase [Actinacidiphila alni]SFF76600.1 Serine phosphatase RsbU, regulator of sigma subunit [Actinacidiphila alni]